MKDFTPLLREINGRLEIPQPKKSRVILEIAADMEDMYQWYLEHGKTEDEAFTEVRQRFEPSPDCLSALIEVHQSTVRRWLEHFSAQTQHLWERALFLIVMLLALFAGIRTIVLNPLIRNASGFIWPILMFGFTIFLIGLIKAYRLYLKKDHSPRTLRSGLDWILFLGSGSLVLAAFGYFWELLNVGKYSIILETKLVYLVCVTDKTFDGTVDFISGWLMRTSSMIMTGILVALLAALIWFFLINKVIKIESSEAELLLNNPNT